MVRTCLTLSNKKKDGVGKYAFVADWPCSLPGFGSQDMTRKKLNRMPENDPVG